MCRLGRRPRPDINAAVTLYISKTGFRRRPYLTGLDRGEREREGEGMMVVGRGGRFVLGATTLKERLGSGKMEVAMSYKTCFPRGVKGVQNGC